MTPLFKKLNLGACDTILVLNSPASFETQLSSLAGVSILRESGKKPTMPFAIAFAVSQSELDDVSNRLVNCTDGDAIVWVAYPKKSSKIYRCEFNRDNGWDVLGNAGFEPVRQVAIDDDWSALRFRRTQYIRSMTRNNAMAISSEGKRRTKK
jgi:hypothetical protein